MVTLYESKAVTFGVEAAVTSAARAPAIGSWSPVIVLFEHGKSPVRGSVPIGRNVWIKQDNVGRGRILAKTRFAEDEFSDLLFSFYKDGTMRGWSISILPEDVGPPSRDEVRSRPELKECELVYRTSEMLEYSAVGIPGAADCLSDPELRSLSTLVMRGFWTPTEDVKPLVEPIVERMCESGGMAEGGALVDDDAEPKKKKKKRSADDEGEDEDGDEAERSMADEGGDAAEPDAATDEPTIERDVAEEVPADPPVASSTRDASLGLRLARDLIELHGGDLSLEPLGPDAGARLTMRLPAATPPG